MLYYLNYNIIKISIALFLYKNGVFYSSVATCRRQQGGKVPNFKLKASDIEADRKNQPLGFRWKTDPFSSWNQPTFAEQSGGFYFRAKLASNRNYVTFQ